MLYTPPLFPHMHCLPFSAQGDRPPPHSTNPHYAPAAPPHPMNTAQFASALPPALALPVVEGVGAGRRRHRHARQLAQMRWHRPRRLLLVALLHRVLHQQEVALVAGHHAAHEQQVALGVNLQKPVREGVGSLPSSVGRAGCTKLQLSQGGRSI